MFEYQVGDKVVWIGSPTRPVGFERRRRNRVYTITRKSVTFGDIYYFDLDDGTEGYAQPQDLELESNFKLLKQMHEEIKSKRAKQI